MSFIHLQVHSEYSLIDGLIRLKPLFKQAQQQAIPAIAITDHHNLFALVKSYRAALAAGIKLIVGADVWIREGKQTYRLVLLCQNQAGYLNLNRLLSKAYQQGQYLGKPYLQRDWLVAHQQGLIMLSGGVQGDIAHALLRDDLALAKQRAQTWQSIFPQRFYLSIQRTGRAQEEDWVRGCVTLATELDLPIVAVNEVCFLKEDDFEAHEVRVCIHQGYALSDPRRPKQYSTQQYLRSAEEMQTLFADLPEAIENTVLIAQRCNVHLTLGKNFLPDFPIPAGQTMAAYFAEQSRIGLEARLEFLFPNEVEQHRALYDERLKIELDVIIQMDFPGYFLIVAEFIQWAKDHDIPVGPGRGSGAGSLIAYALNITDLDPLAYDLLFERFLNPERVSMPDFDVDFCMDRRDEVIQHVAELYGRDKVAQIITYGSMAAKAVVRDVGRALGNGYGFVDQIAKLIPFEIGMTLTKALEQEDQLQQRYDQDEEVKTLLNMALQLEGLSRNAGKHAGGVVIAPSTLTDFSPLYCDDEEGRNIVTQYDKNDVEAVGLVKFDFLGLRTLTIIDWAIQAIQKAGLTKERINILSIPLDDKATFDLLKAAKTTAVFQLESRGMKELIKRLKPDTFEDIIALVALFRPGPLQSGMVDDFINRKHGLAKVEYLHPDLQDNEELKVVLDPTYGVIVYQEQVMQIAQVLSGYSLGGADILRRAMGKKDPSIMAKQRTVFVDGAVENNMKSETADYVFDFVEKFSGYGFNKSHSAAYALVSYQTAWLKTKYPAAFMAAVLSADMDNTDKVVMLIDECVQLNISVEAPHVNHSDYKFILTDDGSGIYYGLGAIKGAGEAALLNLIKQRQDHGDYKDIFDFCQRIDLRKCNRRVLESLIKSGGLDNLNSQSPGRSSLLASLNTVLKMAEQHSKADGQNDLFGMPGTQVDVERHEDLPYQVAPEWTDKQRLKFEKDTLGLYLSGHPLDSYREELARYSKPLSSIAPTRRGQTCKVAGLIIAIRRINSRRGRMAAITLDDGSSRLDVTVFNELYEQCQDQLGMDQLIIAEGEVREDSYSGGYSMTVSNLYSLAQIRSRHLKYIQLNINADQHDPAIVDQLKQTLQAWRDSSGCPLQINYQWQQAQAQLAVDPDWRVLPDDDMLDVLRGMLGQDGVSLLA